MPENTQLDGKQFDRLFFPYDRITAELSEEPRIIRGLNSYITMGGKLAKRPGTVEVDDFGSDYRCDRLWLYETLESPPQLYILGSFYDPADVRWNMYYNDRGGSAGWVTMGTTRSLSNSIAPHEVCISRGLAYIRAVPPSGDSDKYGTTIFDGTGGSPVVRLWGLAAPTTPARVVGAVTRLSAAISSSAVTISVVTKSGFPVGFPFTIQLEYEQLSVTADAGGLDYTVTRAFNGTTAAAHEDDTVLLWRDWAASDHRVDVNYGWTYTYAWKSVTGHLSNRAPLNTNFDLMPSATGPFYDLKPKIHVVGNADTTNIPQIVVYRTTDGGGTFFELETITNTGAGNIVYTDDSLGTGASSTTFNDPLPDYALDTGNIAPSLTSNSPPPTVLAPQITGTNDPDIGSPIVSYSGRLWYAIGNVLFFSAQEELNEGIPEEAWPSGIKGNFFRLQYPILNLASTNDALYIFTVQNTFALTGSNRETFNIRPLYENLGTPYGHPRAVTRFGNRVAFLTHDFRIAVIEGDADPVIISDPLFTDIIDQINIDTTNMECEIDYWGDLEKEWLVVAIHNKALPETSRQWVYDIKLSIQEKKHFWNTPWLIPTCALLSGRIAESQSQRRLCFFLYDEGIPYARMARIDPTGRTATDLTVNDDVEGGVTGITFYVDTHLHLVPGGNHVNMLRIPGLNPVVQYISVERTFTPADVIPDFYYYKDDFWSDPIAADYVEEVSRRDISTGYQTIQVHINEVAYRFAFRIQKVNSVNIIEIQNYAVVWSPDGGV